jgi:hypothetical protein
MQMYYSRHRAHVSIEKQGRNISAHAKRCRCPFDIYTFPHLHRRASSFECVLLQDYTTYLCIYSRVYVILSMFICVNIIQLRYLQYKGLAQ